MQLTGARAPLASQQRVTGLAGSGRRALAQLARRVGPRPGIGSNGANGSLWPAGRPGLAARGDGSDCLHYQRLPSHRIAELVVVRIFGVPGDYTLRLLDQVVAHQQLSWVGTTNEFNAGYAADGYGRVRGTQP